MSNLRVLAILKIELELSRMISQVGTRSIGKVIQMLMTYYVSAILYFRVMRKLKNGIVIDLERTKITTSLSLD